MRIKKIFVRACVDTREFFGWNRKTLVVPLLFIMGLYIHSRTTVNPVEPFEQLVTWLTYTAAPLGIFTFCLFLWNLACAPYRIEKDTHDGTKKLLPREWSEPLAPNRPSEEKIFAGIINRRESFTLKESALLLVDSKITGELSVAAKAQLQELRTMMRDRRIERFDRGTALERMYSTDPMRFMQMIQNNELPSPPEIAKITRNELHKLSVTLGLPIAGLEP